MSEVDNEAIALDSQARQLALDPAQSILLQAPAGSGKTTVLTSRYLALLGTVDQPEEVLAVTFTRKAAAEMRRRVIQSLQSHGACADAGITGAVLERAVQRDRSQQWDLLRNPSRLRIETIDALNYRLASQLPIAARASPGLRIAADARPLYRRAARRCLEQSEHDPEVAEAANLVFERLDNDWSRIEQRLADMLQQRSHWLPRVVEQDSESLVGRIEDSLTMALRAELVRVITPFSDTLLRESEIALTHALRQRGLALPPAGLKLNAEPASVGSWRALAALMLTGRDWRKSLSVRDGFAPTDKPMKTRVTELRDALSRTAGTREALLAAACLPDARLGGDDREALAALSVLLIRAAAELHLVFAEKGSVDFSYVSRAAYAALTEEGEPSDLALRTGSAIRHILVDEFQDTSYEQRNLLLALTRTWERGDGRTLFVVGDPMQSIYQFREAEVGIFLQARDHGIGELTLRGLRLRRNFRSRARVIEWVNDHFGRLFPLQDDPRLAAISYLSSLPARKGDADEGPPATLYAFDEKDLTGEAAAVLDIVRAARERDPLASIAVLVAARKHAELIVARLVGARFAVRGLDLEPLNERAVVRDLAALTRALLHASDHTAWYALLRAPWCGLTLAELESLALMECSDVHRHLVAAADSLSPESSPRVQRLLAALTPAWEGAERGLPLWQRVEHCWLRLGGPLIHASEADRLDADRYIDALAEHDDPESLVGEALGEITRSLYSSAPAQPGAIEVMTMHAAKGLEWDVVILPGLGRRTASTADRLLHWIELPRAREITDLLIAPIRTAEKERPESLAAYIKRLRRERTAQERVRLLYVAATRARKALHLLGGLMASKSELPPVPFPRSLLSVLWPALGEVFLERYRETMAATRSALPSPSPPAQQRLPADWQLPAMPTPPGLTRMSVESAVPAAQPEYSWVGLASRGVGTIVHAELHRLSSATVDLRRADLLDRDYGPWLAELGVDAAERSDAAGRIRGALRRTLDDERGRWLLSNRHPQSRSEWRVSGMHGGRVVNVIFDRMIVDETGQRWLVDYKTSSHQGGAIEQFIAREVERYRPQMQRYLALARLREPSAIRAALYFPLLGVFRELQGL